MQTQAFVNAKVFDGEAFRGGPLVVQGGQIVSVGEGVPEGAEVMALDGGILAPGFVDLQVNGGGGVMLNDAPDATTLARMAAAHARLGTTALLPTLITDRPAVTLAAIAAVEAAIAAGIPGVAGLHLEGPHLSLARKGAHDPGLIRPMTEGDLAVLCAAARRLPCLLLTVAPESVTDAQIAALKAAGAVIALGHTDAGFDVAMRAAAAGASVVTHLFNAMSQLGHREPGLVGAALANGSLSAGLIADGIHVHPAAMRVALAAKAGPGQVFLVTDAMATAGSGIASFTLNGRTIHRRNGRLTLDDGTLAGADLDFCQALRVLVQQAGLPVERALAMATGIPAAVAGLAAGRLAPGLAADMVHLSDDLHLRAVWQGGRRIDMEKTAD